MITPCKNICKINKYTERCIGCRRTRKQIANWSSYSDKVKKIIIEELKSGNMARSTVSTNKPMDDA